MYEYVWCHHCLSRWLSQSVSFLAQDHLGLTGGTTMTVAKNKIINNINRLWIPLSTRSTAQVPPEELLAVTGEDYVTKTRSLVLALCRPAETHGTDVTPNVSLRVVCKILSRLDKHRLSESNPLLKTTEQHEFYSHLFQGTSNAVY